MKIRSVVLIVPVLVFSLFSAKMSSAADVKTDYDRNANFRRYKTYCWLKVETRNPLWIERIKAAVNAELTAKGWTQAESDSSCDVSVVAIGIKRNHDTVNTFYDNVGGGWGGWGWRGFGGGGFGEATSTTETYQTGTLIVDFFDAKTKSLVWRGAATDTLSDKPDKNIKKLVNSVHKLFEHFPPQTKS